MKHQHTRRGGTQIKSIKTRSHSRTSLSGISTTVKKQGLDPRQKLSGMTPNLDNIPLIRATPTFPLMGKSSSPARRGEGNAARGFTLIELLVVVLIIGILAAIALPQYQKAIDKSNYGAMMAVARSIESAQDAFYMEHGRYATDWDELDVSYSKDLPKNSEGRIVIGKGGFLLDTPYTSAIYFHGEDRIAAFTQYHRLGTHSYKGKAYCFSYNNSYRERAKAICLSFGGALQKTDNNCTSGTPCEYYLLHNI